ncbi:hypothetical protein B5X24_HaOG215223 [Helicoverpa armigera]|nr:hypothetical protein B5X24_HaOG215223 [Helicoverpa armigera]
MVVTTKIDARSHRPFFVPLKVHNGLYHDNTLQNQQWNAKCHLSIACHFRGDSIFGRKLGTYQIVGKLSTISIFESDSFV